MLRGPKPIILTPSQKLLLCAMFRPHRKLVFIAEGETTTVRVICTEPVFIELEVPLSDFRFGRSAGWYHHDASQTVFTLSQLGRQIAKRICP